MIASYRWLNDYVKIPVSPEELAERMIMIGNGVERIAKLDQGLDHIVVGKIETISKHPNADKLQICQIDVGKETLQIVTGADNVFEGAFVPVATIGAILPDGTKIKKGKLRGEDSFGMLCSGEELSLKEADYPGAGVYGILILQEEYAPGTPMAQVLMRDDTILEFEVGANRPDCLSMMGIAREAAAALNLPAEFPEPVFQAKGGNLQEKINVEVQAGDLCTRYMARGIQNVRIAPSPQWMQERLKAAGIRPINNIVDITNFVMLEVGQPMHAFDHRQIRGGKIIVRRANKGESIRTLDEKERTLSESMLLICDAQGPIGIAGIMGGENSEITAETKTVIFESAKFAYGNIRQTSRALGLSTESSMRFSKGIDASIAEYAINRACQLVELLNAGEIMQGTIDIVNEDLSPLEITVSARRINRLLGTNLSKQEMIACLKRVSILVAEKEGETFSCLIPRYRSDIFGEADIAEEVARIYGYDRIPMHDVSGSLMHAPANRMEQTTDQIRHMLAAKGYYESITYSFMGESDFDQLCLPKEDALRKAVRIKNPLGEDSALMRTTLAKSMLSVLSTNLNRKNKEVKLFEINKVYWTEQLPIVDQLPKDPKMLAIAMNEACGDFYALKADVEAVLSLMHVPEADISAEGPAFYHPGRKATMCIGNEIVAELGEIHPDVQQNFGIPQRVYFAQINLSALLPMGEWKPRFHALPKYPAVERDIAIVVEKGTPAGTLRKQILQSGGKKLESVTLFDVYEGVNVGLGKKSLAYALCFRSTEKTLSEADIAPCMERILSMIQEKFGGFLRE